MIAVPDKWVLICHMVLIWLASNYVFSCYDVVEKNNI